METNYKFTVDSNNEVIFTNDEEVINAHDQLVQTIEESFKYNSEDANSYATYLKNLCLNEYQKEYQDTIDKIKSYSKDELSPIRLALYLFYKRNKEV